MWESSPSGSAGERASCSSACHRIKRRIIVREHLFFISIQGGFLFVATHAVHCVWLYTNNATIALLELEAAQRYFTVGFTTQTDQDGINPTESFKFYLFIHSSLVTAPRLSRVTQTEAVQCLHLQLVKPSSDNGQHYTLLSDDLNPVTFVLVLIS